MYTDGLWERAARCGECVSWTLDDNIDAAVSRLCDPQTESVRIPNDPDIIAELFARLRARIIAECKGNA